MANGLSDGSSRLQKPLMNGRTERSRHWLYPI